MKVGIVVHHGVEVLDFAGPVEVFDAAGGEMQIEGKRLFEVILVAPKKEPVRAHGGLTILPAFSIADAPPLDLLVIPGGETNVLESDPAFLAWVRETVPKTRVTMSVCTGAFVLGKLGLLDGAEATTYHGSLDGLRRSAPKAKVLQGRRVVDAGRIVTAGGVSCGIDGALHVVARLGGRALADNVAEYMEFRWIPEPQLEGSYSRFCRLGGDRTEIAQELKAKRKTADWPAAEKLARELIDLDPDDGLAWYELGYALLSQSKYDESIVANEEAGKLPGRPCTALYNVCCAWTKKGDKDKAFDALSRAVDAGWADRAWTEKDEDLQSLRGDARFAALLERIRKPAPAAPAKESASPAAKDSGS